MLGYLKLGRFLHNISRLSLVPVCIHDDIIGQLRVNDTANGLSADSYADTTSYSSDSGASMSDVDCKSLTSQCGSQKRHAVIAHRGASAYLPEHTLAAKTLAHAMGADFIEQDVVLSKDGFPIVLHDVCCDTTTNIRDVFPDRARPDGRFYAIDFTLNELRSLRVSERFDIVTGMPIYPGRFPLGKSRFEIVTLADELELIQGLNQSTGRSAGVCVEVKSPAWHLKQGHDVSAVVVQTLARYGYIENSDNAWVQCFDAAELLRIRVTLACRLKLIQLVGENSWNESLTDYDLLRTTEGLQRTSSYANAISPWLPQVLSVVDGKPKPTGLVERAHAAGLLVYPYTFRADELPDNVAQAYEYFSMLVNSGIDGLFTDQPDLVGEFLRRLSSI